MPGYIIHLAAAKELQPLLEQQQILRSEEDRNAFLVSCLIPDSADNKATTHYRQTDDRSVQIRYPQPWNFLQPLSTFNPNTSRNRLSFPPLCGLFILSGIFFPSYPFNRPRSQPANSKG